MKRGTPDHIKTKRLARALDLPLYAAAGLLEMLWHRTVSLAPAGDIGRLDDAEIAQEMDWKGDPAALVAAFVRAGWLDRCRCHGLRVHDWPTHADQTLKRALSNNGKDFLACYADASTLLASDEQETSCRSRAVAVPGLAKPEPLPDPVPIAIKPAGRAQVVVTSEATGISRPAFEWEPHPFIPTRERRQELESEAYRLAREIADMRDRPGVQPGCDPMEVFSEASGYKQRDGTEKRKVRAESMTNDRLLLTLTDLRATHAAELVRLEKLKTVETLQQRRSAPGAA